MKKRFLSLLLVFCMMLSLSVMPVSAASPKVYDKMSDSYKKGPYYQKLMSVNLTGNQINDLINVARSQVGYHAGGSANDLSGTSKSEAKYVEYFNLISPSTMPNDWCATFVTWCFREAGIPTSIMPNATGCGKIRNTGGKNKDKYGAVYHTLESGYKPKKGDLVLYEHIEGPKGNKYYVRASRDANGVPSTSSHVGIVSEDYNPSKNTFKTIQRKGTVVKEYDEDMNATGWNNAEHTKKIKKIQGFVTPAYNGRTAVSTPILTMYYNTNGGVITSDTYSQTSAGMVQKNGRNVTSQWEYGSGDPTYGLWDASTYGLSRDGYKIQGWSLSKDGSTEIFGQNDLQLKAEDIYPNVKNGDSEVTLYAVWTPVDGSIPYKLTINYNTNYGVIDSKTYSQDGNDYVYQNGKLFTVVWKYGEGDSKYGLSDASTFGLTKDNEKFVGWSLSPSGTSTIFGQNDFELKAEDIYPDLIDGDAEVVLYAVWAPQGWAVTPLPVPESEPDEDSNVYLDEDMTESSDEELAAEQEETPPSQEPEPSTEPEPATEPEPVAEPEPEPETPAKNTIVMKIDDPLMLVNGKVTPVDELGNTPVIRNSRTMLPIASVMLAMDGTVGWEGSTKTVTLKRGGKTMFLRIGTSFAWDENGLAVAQLDSPPIIINGRTMLPVAAIVLYFGADISWDGTTRSVTITY